LSGYPLSWGCIISFICRPYFAGLVDEKYVIRGGLFFKFTQQYEEAKYSSHVFSPEVSAAALGIYNQILEAIFVQQNKRARVYTYLMALINRVPLRVNKTKQIRYIRGYRFIQG